MSDKQPDLPNKPSTKTRSRGRVRKQDKGGQLPHMPTDANRELVERLARNGVPHEKIGLLMKLGHTTLHKYYAVEFARGQASGIAALCECAMRGALGTPAVHKVVSKDGHTTIEEVTEEIPPDRTLQIFLLKTRAGYREVIPTEERRPDEGKNLEHGISGPLTESERTARVLAILNRARDRATRGAPNSASAVGSNVGSATSSAGKSSG